MDPVLAFLRSLPYFSTRSLFLLTLRAHAILSALHRHCCVLGEFLICVCLHCHVPEGRVVSMLIQSLSQHVLYIWGTAGEHVTEPMWRGPFPVLTLPRVGVQALEAVSNLTEASTCSVILQLPSILACVTELLFLDYSEEWPLIPFMTCNLSTPLPSRSTLGLTCLVLTLELAQTFHPTVATVGSILHPGWNWAPYLPCSTIYLPWLCTHCGSPLCLPQVLKRDLGALILPWLWISEPQLPWSACSSSASDLISAHFSCWHNPVGSSLLPWLEGLAFKTFHNPSHSGLVIWPSLFQFCLNITQPIAFSTFPAGLWTFLASLAVSAFLFYFL